jgi:hypothetical protein
MSGQEKQIEGSGIAGNNGPLPATSQTVGREAGDAGMATEKPKRRSTAKTKVASGTDAEPAKPRRTGSAKARNVIVTPDANSDIRMEGAKKQSKPPSRDSHDLPPLPPAPVPTPEGIAFMQQHFAYQSALEARIKHELARLEQPARGSRDQTSHAAQQIVGTGKLPSVLAGEGAEGRDDSAAVAPGTAGPSKVRPRKSKENSIEPGRYIQNAMTGDPDQQAVKGHDDARLLRQLLEHSRVLPGLAESNAPEPRIVDAVRSDVETIRAIKDPVARKLGIAVVEQNRQVDARYRAEFDKLAPEFMWTGEKAPAEGSATARSSAPTQMSDTKAPTMSTAVPESVSKRFLKVDSDYFFPDCSPAFVDRGAKLATRGEHPEVVRALVEIAKERGWDSVTVKGSEAFRRAAWMEAARNGMQIAGYKPTELDLAQLKQREPNNSIEPVQVRDQGAHHTVPLAKWTDGKQAGRTQEEKLSAFVNDRPTLVVKRFPELVQAYALLDAARKFAEVHMPGHEERFVAIGRELITQQIRDGKEVVGPKIQPEQLSPSRPGQQKAVATPAREILHER